MFVSNILPLLLTPPIGIWANWREVWVCRVSGECRCEPAHPGHSPGLGIPALNSPLLSGRVPVC
jgi:hypothetical protein